MEPRGAAQVPFHDWWTYLRLSAVGAQVQVHDARVLYYRQHGSQTLGAHRGLIAGAQRMGALAGGRYRAWVKQNLTAPLGVNSKQICSVEVRFEVLIETSNGTSTRR